MSTAAIHSMLLGSASRAFAPASLTVKLRSHTSRFTSSYILPVTSRERRVPAWRPPTSQALRVATPAASWSRRWVWGSCRAGQIPDP